MTQLRNFLIGMAFLFAAPLSFWLCGAASYPGTDRVIGALVGSALCLIFAGVLHLEG